MRAIVWTGLVLVSVFFDKKLGFALQRYHDTLLSFGSPPVHFARALMLDLPIEPPRRQ